jgi:hypothetical protein
MYMKRLLCLALPLCLFAGLACAAPKDVAIPEVAESERIGFALYTVNNNILKMTVQFYPLKDGESRTAFLQLEEEGQWKDIDETVITEDGYGNADGDKTWTAHFHMEGWDMTRDHTYRVSALDGKALYEGRIRRDPVEKDTILVGVFSCNSIYEQHGGYAPRTDIIENIKKTDPDLLFFAGDQVYDHKHHLGYWLKFGRQFGEIIRDRPTITIPDDHDVGHGNLWGAGGKKSMTMAGHDGGYFMPVSYVKAVERAQTWHLPDPFDPTPVLQGIGVYYTAMTLGRISFAIIEDRKFKSGPLGLVPQQGPRPDHILNPDYDPKSIDVPGAELLGERQLHFLDVWGQDWRGADMKAVLSQTIFCGGAHLHGEKRERLHADLDSNGWPQTGRNKALDKIRRCFAVHLAGDQHVATIFHHGIDDWEDACYSFCMPAVANLYPRWWAPERPGENRQPGMPEYTGRHLDGFANKVTCWAVANPPEDISQGDKLAVRAAGFGIVRFNKPTREITLECWPRNVDIDNPEAQYPGWPKTIAQEDNYGRAAVAWLPTLNISGQENPVVQVIDESNGEVLYTLRIKGTTYRPKVFREGVYTVNVGEGADMKTLTGIQSLKAEENNRIEVPF